MKKQQKSLISQIIVGILVILIGINVYLMLNNIDVLNQIEKAKTALPEDIKIKNEIIKQLNLTSDPLSTNGFTIYKESEIALQSNDLVLTKNCTELRIVTNEYQAYTIEYGLKNKIDIRPTAHDVASSLLEYYNITLLDVRIVEARDPHYFARAVFIQNNRILNIDLKASDAVALAVRTNSPIYINNKIIESKSKKTC